MGNASLKNDQLVFTPYRPAGRHDFNPTSMVNIQRVQDMERVNPNSVASSLNHYGQLKGRSVVGNDGSFPDNMQDVRLQHIKRNSMGPPQLERYADEAPPM